MLPKFLLADNYEFPDKVFVVHTESPRFIVESSVDDFYDDQEIHWIDEEPKDQEEVERLIDEAEDYYITEFEELENSYDEDDE